MKGISEGNKERGKDMLFLLSPNLKNIEDRTFDIVFTHSSISHFDFLSYIVYSRSQTNFCVHDNTVLRQVFCLVQ